MRRWAVIVQRRPINIGFGGGGDLGEATAQMSSCEQYSRMENLRQGLFYRRTRGDGIIIVTIGLLESGGNRDVVSEEATQYHSASAYNHASAVRGRYGGDARWRDERANCELGIGIAVRQVLYGYGV